MYQNYNIGQTQFILNYDFTVPKNHITRLTNIFVDSIPQEELLEKILRQLVGPRLTRQLCLKSCYLLMLVKLTLVANLKQCWKKIYLCVG